MPEYFYKVGTDTELLVLADGQSVTADEYTRLVDSGAQGVPKVIRKRQVRDVKVKWCRMSGAEVLEENEFPCRYIPIIPAFIHYWQKFSGALRCKIVRYNVPPPSLPKPQFSQFAVGPQAEYTFSQGLRKYLYHHPLDLVLIVLDDYFLTEKIDRKRLDAAIKLMQERMEISKIDLSADLAKHATGKLYK